VAVFLYFAQQNFFKDDPIWAKPPFWFFLVTRALIYVLFAAIKCGRENIQPTSSKSSTPSVGLDSYS